MSDKPTAEATRVATEMMLKWHAEAEEYFEIEDRRKMIDAIATLITAKDAENQRLVQDLTSAECERGELKRENQQQRALLVRLAYASMKVVNVWKQQLGRVFESMGEDNPRAHAIDIEISDLSVMLSTPAVVELLKEAKTL